MRFEIEDGIAEDDRVVMGIPIHGKHVGAFRGAAPTGKIIQATETIITRLVEGKIIKDWEDWSEPGFFQPIGAIGAIHGG